MIWPRNGISVSSRSGAFASERVSGRGAAVLPVERTGQERRLVARREAGRGSIVPRPLRDPARDQRPVGAVRRFSLRRVRDVGQQVRELGPPGQHALERGLERRGDADEVAVGAPGRRSRYS